ncbi:phage tail protein [Vibrio splendidus]|uniref:phage tail protein n=1 Tax=Vibrio splendidus TaxID=29497 RepID=UPI000C85D204|nr:phage tail protein [Vibrio splendidus]PMI49571.1 hypothetical protein BCU42_14350 [Vibrio splendidus]
MSEPNNDFVSVQPENRTLIEEGLEYGWHKILEAQNDPYPELKQPMLTSDEFVSLLAGERGVLDWQPNDTLLQRRQTTEQAFDIHRKAGTRGGLKTALDVLGFDSVITKAPQAYALEVEAFLQDDPLTDETSKRVDSRLKNYKSERDSVSVNIARQSNSLVSVGVTTQIGITMTSEPFVPSGFISEAAQSTSIYNHIRIIATSEPAIQ